MREHAQDVARAISQVPGAADVQVDQVMGTPQLVIRIDRPVVARYGINVEDVQRTISASVGGKVAGQGIATPALADGTIYIRGKDRLWAIRKAAR